jgi:hypothetical protein
MCGVISQLVRSRLSTALFAERGSTTEHYSASFRAVRSKNDASLKGNQLASSAKLPMETSKGPFLQVGEAASTQGTELWVCYRCPFKKARKRPASLAVT